MTDRPDWWPEDVTLSDGTVVRFAYRPSPSMSDHLASIPPAEARELYRAIARDLLGSCVRGQEPDLNADPTLQMGVATERPPASEGNG